MKVIHIVVDSEWPIEAIKDGLKEFFLSADVKVESITGFDISNLKPVDPLLEDDE